MRCDRFLSRYDELEPGRELSLFLALHHARCSSCRAAVATFESAIASWKEEELGAEDQDLAAFDLLEERTMVAIRLTSRPRREIGLAQWAAPGLLVAFSCVVLPFLGALRGASGDAVFLPLALALVFGIGLSIFGSIFVGTHTTMLKAGFDRMTEAFAHSRH